MRQHLLVVFLSFLFLNMLAAQTGCPGCALSLPANLPADTLYLPVFPDGEKGVPYNQDISFRIPKTTTPVYAVDSITPPGLTITKIEIVGIDDMPPGLFWEASQMVFQPATETDGCIKICGTPLASDSFVMTVKLKATVLIFNQEASFPIRLYISPKTSTTVGFSMSDIIGCGSTTVTFANNIPSNGLTGFTYEWDFGDSTKYAGENPPPHTYNQPGTYEVTYKATIDTAGYRLVSVKVLAAGCTDLFSGPDLFVKVFAPGGQKIFENADVANTPLPYTFPIDLVLDPQINYMLEIWDEDSGIDGTDDLCSSLPFNVLSGGDTLISGALQVVLTIDNPIEEVLSSDTVVVYPLPITPVISPNLLAACPDEIIVLQSSFGGTNQWLLDGDPIPGATDFLYLPDQSGLYQVQVTNMYGCTAVSEQASVEFYPLPGEPVYQNDRNNLELLDTTALPANYALQWYLFNGPISGATGFEYCATESGTYTLEVTDLSTGCTNTYTTTVTVNPIFDCTVGARDLAVGTLNIFPNPASGMATVQIDEPLPANTILRIWDVAGRLSRSLPVGAGADQILLEGGILNPGMYFLEIVTGEKRFTGRLVVVW
ncbi:MAG: T9SS type A sorting domain-containing protein [Lewinellaceae bacterium]|nr:T9SS type A sorting domain-containing protein [Lewinellaceae bacterium]